MIEPASHRTLVVLLAGGLALCLPRWPLSFSSARQLSPSPLGLAHPGSTAATSVLELHAVSDDVRGRTLVGGSDTLRLCGLAAALVASVRAAKIVMQSQGQGGRFNYGQAGMPRVKCAKRFAAHVLNKKKVFGSSRTRKRPKRYALYDLLEKLDETLPAYTVLEEPDEPLEAVEDVPITERYPWAGNLDGIPTKKKQEERMEPYFGSWTRMSPPPLGRTQRYIHRSGWPKYNSPPWLNRPLIGTGVKTPGWIPWSTDRRPRDWQFYPDQLQELADGPDEVFRNYHPSVKRAVAAIRRGGDDEEEEEDEGPIDIDALVSGV